MEMFSMTFQARWFILFLVFFALGQADEVCQDSYNGGFYDPCADVNCNFDCPSTSVKRITVADPEDCQSYFLCLDGHLLPQRCEDGYRFNFNLHACRKQSDEYDKCQQPCRDNQYKNFVLRPTFRETTTMPITTEKHTTSSSGADSTAHSESSQTEALTTHGRSDTISSATLKPELTSTSSRSEELSTKYSTDLCVILHSNTSDEDVIKLLCEWTCDANYIASPAEFQWYKDGLLLSNASYLCASNDEEDKDDVNDDEDDQTEPCVNALNGLSSTWKINTSEEYEGLYHCTVLSSEGRKYRSNTTALAPPLALNWKQEVDLDASVVVVTCGLHRLDGRMVSQRSCDGYFWWNASDYKEVNRSRCTQSIELKVDFRKNSTFSCQWKSSTGLFFSHTFLLLQVHDVCLPNVDYGIFWNASRANSSLEKSCPGFPHAFARRSCVLNDTNIPAWTLTNFTECTYEEFLKIFYELKSIEDSDKDYPIISSLASNLSTLTKTGNLDPPLLNITIQCLKLLILIRSNSIHQSAVTDNEVKSVMEIVSNILDRSNMESWKLLRKVDAGIATSIMKAIDLYLVQIGPTEEVFQSNLVIKASIVPDMSDNVMKIQASQYNSFDVIPHTFDNISLSLNFFKSNPHYFVTGLSPPSYRVYTVLYTNLQDILPVQKNDSFLASRILMIRTSSPDQVWVSGGMNVTFAHTMRNISAQFSSSCVFWNFSLGQNGDWSNVGCRVLWSNENATTCSCDHMTNFAILMSIDQEVLVDNVAMRTISLVGCSVSIVGLFLTIFILAITWKKAKMTHHYAILINLCVALIIANVIFIAGIDKTQPREACITVATLLHLFFMAAFFLMLAEGVQLLLYVVHVFHVQRNFETAIIITSAWVLALVVVGVSLAVSGTKGYGTSEHCWLSHTDGLVWAFIGPALFIILINLCILFVVLYKASRKKTTSDKQDIKSQMKKAVWNMLVISPLLGITWVFGVLSVSSPLVAFQYIFAVVNSLQGLFIFIFHGFCRQLKLKRRLSKSSCSKDDKQEMRKVGLSKHVDTISNKYLQRSISNDYHVPPRHVAEAKNTAIFSNDETTEDFIGPIFGTVYGSQSTESSYVGSVSSQ